MSNNQTSRKTMITVAMICALAGFAAGIGMGKIFFSPPEEGPKFKAFTGCPPASRAGHPCKLKSGQCKYVKNYNGKFAGQSCE